MVFQDYALYPHMTVADNLAFGLRLSKMPRAERERRVARVATTLGLEELLDRKPGALSGGQRQRVAMGRAIVREPKAFLMDEPLSNLDAMLRVSMRSELARMHERLSTTTVYVTHDQIEAMTLGHRVAVLRDGVLQQLDTPQQLYHHPVNVFVAAFIGSPAMNLVEAHVERGMAHVGELSIPLPTDDARRRRARRRARDSADRLRAGRNRGPPPAAHHRPARGRRGPRPGAEAHLRCERASTASRADTGGDSRIVGSGWAPARRRRAVAHDRACPTPNLLRGRQRPSSWPLITVVCISSIAKRAAPCTSRKRSGRSQSTTEGVDWSET